LRKRIRAVDSPRLPDRDPSSPLPPLSPNPYFFFLSFCNHADVRKKEKKKKKKKKRRRKKDRRKNGSP